MAEFIRQQSLIDQQKLSQLHIAIIGTGAIGSFTALALTKMGASHLSLWDKDNVELHNISNQFFTRESLGTPKVLVVRDECRRIAPSDIDIEFSTDLYQGQPLDKYDVAIALTDNIEGRKACFEASQKSAKCQLFIDGRMSAELFRSFAFSPKSKTECEEYYNDYIDGVVNEELPCTARSIIYNVLFASSIISSYVKKFVTGEKIPFQSLFNFQSFAFTKSELR